LQKIFFKISKINYKKGMSKKKKKKKKKLGRNFGESHSPVTTSYLINIFHIEIWAKISKNYSNLQ